MYRSILNLIWIFSLIDLNIVYAVKPTPFILKVDKYNDFTFDANQECIQNGEEPLNIELSQEIIDHSFNTRDDGGGMLHSPNYKRVALEPRHQQAFLYNNNKVDDEYDNINEKVKKLKCKWNLIAPQDYDLLIKIIDISSSSSSQTGESKPNASNCLDSRLAISVNNHDSKLWLNFLDKNTNSLFNYEQTRLDSCNFTFQPFLTINSNTNRLSIEYESNSNADMNFLLSFKPIKRVENNRDTSINSECNKITEMRCDVQFNQTLNQKTCINKDLICNCLSLIPQINTLAMIDYSERFNYVDNCDYLIEKYENYLQALKADSICTYHLNLNTKCRFDASSSLTSISLNENSDLDYQLPPSRSDLDTSYIPSSSSSQINHNGHLFKIENLKLNQQDYEDFCSNVFKTNEFGWIGSPNFYKQKTSNYDGGVNLNCTYRIWTQLYQSVQLRFNYFNINLNDTMIIYDGPNENFPLLTQFSSANNDFNKYFNAKTFNSRTNQLYIVFQTKTLIKNNSIPNIVNNSNKLIGFNFTYQIKGYCIEDQLPCNSIYELNCYSPNQTCNDVWDCHNGADERGCGPCKSDQFRCKNHIFCYRLEDRCDGDNQCIDKSDEMNCDKWFCNSNNGTFLCKNGRCVYEQWVCDGKLIFFS
jgi:hypothetical protein